MSNDRCRNVMYECTKITPNNDILPMNIKLVLEYIMKLKKVPLMHLLIVVLSGVAHWCSRTLLNVDIDWDVPLIFFGVIIGYPGSNKSTAIGLIEKATREIEQYLQIKIEDSRINGSVTIESLLHELEKKRSIIQAFDEFNTFASSFSLYRADKATYYRSVLNTLWNGPQCYFFFRQLVKGDIKCENSWLSIVAAAHPGAIINMLKEENNPLGCDGLFTRFIFSARISPEDVHKRARHDDDDTNEFDNDTCSYPSLTHVMYFIYLMHHDDVYKLKLSRDANEILIRAHNDYNNMVIGFQGYQDILCTLFSKSRDHLYRLCGLLHILHQACSYALKVKPHLQYLIFDDAAAESIQNMALIAKKNINEYLTIPGDIAETSVQLMRSYVDTKKLLYGFPLITIPPTDKINVGPSVSQQTFIPDEERHSVGASDIRSNSSKSNTSSFVGSNIVRNDTSSCSESTALSSSFSAFNGPVFDLTIEKILLYKKRKISSSRLAQILRRPGVNAHNIKKIFGIMAGSEMGSLLVEKQKKHGQPRVSFIKDDIPADKDSLKFKFMIEFLNQFKISVEDYQDHLESESDSSIVSTNFSSSEN